MPRRHQRKQTAPGQPYGEAQRQAHLQSVQPLPEGGPPMPEAGQQQLDQAPQPSLLDIARAGPSPVDPLSGPNPTVGQPLTRGLPSGPGPGPEILPTFRRNRHADLLNTLAVTLDSPRLRRMAARAKRAR